MIAEPTHYVTTVTGIGAESLAGGFFEGWPSPPSPDDHLRLLTHSSHCVLAVRGDDVIGFVTAISDGVLCAYIPLLEVLPVHRGSGIGSKLVRRLLAGIGPVYMIDVMCEPAVIPFYERLGFTPSTGGVIRNFGALA